MASDPFDDDEYHPDEWPEDATRDDYPDGLPVPHGWDKSRGKPCDSNGRPYNPYQGSKTPSEGRCNAMLSDWHERYGEPRYCMGMPESTFVDDGSDFCRNHKSHESLMERASEAFTHGLYAKNIRYTFERLNPWQKLVVLAFYDSYVQESKYDFDEQLQDHEIDFSDYEGQLPIEIASQLDEDETMHVGVPTPREHEVRCFALYRAALMDMKVSLAERKTLPDEDSGAMERETVVSVTDDGREITDLDEHHLNMPISRADNDREDLLRFGGVEMDDDADVAVNVDTPDSMIVDLEEPSPTAETTMDDPNPVEEQLHHTDVDDNTSDGE